MDWRSRASPTGGIPHSYGADFSGVGLWGPRTRERPTAPAPKPAPSTISRRISSQLTIARELVKLFASPDSCYRIPTVVTIGGPDRVGVLAILVWNRRTDAQKRAG